MYSSNSVGSIPSLATTPSSYTYSAMHDPLALPDFCDFDGKNDLMDCSLGFTFPELNSFGGLDLDKLDQLVRMEADLERIERLERFEVEVGSLDSDGEAAISFPPTLIGPSLGLSGWAPSDLNVRFCSALFFERTAINIIGCIDGLFTCLQRGCRHGFRFDRCCCRPSISFTRQ